MHQAVLGNGQSRSGVGRFAVVLTALPVERASVRMYLSNLTEDQSAGTVYDVGTFDRGGATWRVAVAEVGAGNSGAAVETERAIRHFNATVALFVGVAGRLKDVHRGDVVAATKVYGYHSGKSGTDFQPRPDVGLSSHSLVQRARTEASRSDWLPREVDAGYQPRALVAPIAAGEQVVSSTDSATFELVRRYYSDAVAIEMEGNGFLHAAYRNQSVQTLVVRGISDLLNGKEESDTEGWQGIAAENAAAFAFQVLSKLDTSAAAVPVGQGRVAVRADLGSSIMIRQSRIRNHDTGFLAERQSIIDAEDVDLE